MSPRTHPNRRARSQPGAGRLRRHGVVLVMAAGLVLAACGGDDAASDATDVAAPATTAATSGSTSAPATSATAADDAATTETGDPTGNVTVAVATSELGDILVDGDGMTLYVFDNDSEASSACADDCLTSWPPLLGQDPVAGEGVTGDLATFERADSGDAQVMVNGAPLYHWAGDAEPGDVTGHGVGDVWWAVTPSGEAVAASAAGTTDTANLAEGVDDGDY